MAWTFPTDPETGHRYPVRPDGRVHVPIGGLVHSNGAWAGKAVELDKLDKLADLWGFNAVRAFAGLLGTPISHPHHSVPATTSTPPVTLRQVVEAAKAQGMITCIHPTHGGWAGYFDDNWHAVIDQTIDELAGLHDWCWLQLFPEPGSYSGGIGINDWPAVLEAYKYARARRWSGVISLPDHMWGQHGPLHDVDPQRSGVLKFAAAVVDTIGDDSQVVVNCESYGQSWATGRDHLARARMCLDYVNRISELGLYTWVSDWDYRGNYQQPPADIATWYENVSPDITQGAHAWANAATINRGIGLMAWSLTPADIAGEMHLTRPGLPTDVTANTLADRVTWAGVELMAVAELDRPAFISGTTDPPPPVEPPSPAPEFTPTAELTVELEVAAPPPPPPPRPPAVTELVPVPVATVEHEGSIEFAVQTVGPNLATEWRIMTPLPPEVGEVTIDEYGVVSFTAGPGFSGSVNFVVGAR